MKNIYTLKNGIVIEDNSHLGLGVSIGNQSSYYFQLGFDYTLNQFYLTTIGTRLYYNRAQLYDDRGLYNFENEFREMKEVLLEANNLKL